MKDYSQYLQIIISCVSFSTILHKMETQFVFQTAKSKKYAKINHWNLPYYTVVTKYPPNYDFHNVCHIS